MPAADVMVDRPTRVVSTRPPMKRSTERALYGTFTTLGVILAWQLISMMGLLPTEWIPSPVSIGSEAVTQLFLITFWAQLWQTLSIMLLGLAIALVVALPLSLAIGFSTFARDSLFVPIEFLKPIPAVALLPLTLLLWGPTSTMKLVLVVFGAVWPLVVQMTYGVQSINVVAQDMARLFRLTRWERLRSIVAPSILPFTVTGLRISAAIGLIIAVVIEMVAGVPGLGQGITLAQVAGRLPEMYALIVLTGCLGLGVNSAFRQLERKLLFWHPSQRNGE